MKISTEKKYTSGICEISENSKLDMHFYLIIIIYWIENVCEKYLINNNQINVGCG